MDISAAEFLAAAIGLVVALLMIVVGPKNIPDYFRTDRGRGILKGIVMVIGVVVIVAVVGSLTGCSGTWGNYASMYAGLDEVDDSPMCVRGGDQLTSNVGFRGNIYQSSDGRYSANAKYQHHSCAFATDDESYDAYGVELDYKFWTR